MPTCIKCKLDKAQPEFVFHATKKKYENRCKSCKSEYTLDQNRKIRERNRAYVTAFKSGKPCSICHGIFHFCQLDFDHLDSSLKKFELWNISTQSLKTIQAEIAKCRLICANCHRGETQAIFGRIKTDALPHNAKYSQFINGLKDGKTCPDCGKTYPYYIMDFDHLGSKEFELNRAKQLRTDKNKVIAEVAKCDLICVNCHRLRTFRRSKQTSISEASEP